MGQPRTRASRVKTGQATIQLMQIANCVFDRWSPGIGDPTLMGWITVVAYGVSAILCFASLHQSANRSVRVFWLLLAALLAFLMLNKQLDLQSALTAIGRCVSQMQGWYDQRRPVQTLFAGAILALSSAFGLGLFWAMRHQIRTIWLAMLGVVFLLSFVTVRAIGFQNFDVPIGLRVYDVRLNWLLELVGIAMIGANAIWFALFRRQR